MKRTISILFVVVLLFACAWAQEKPQGSVPVVQLQVSRSIKAVNYRANKSTKIDFAGTALVPRAEGKAKVESKQGRTLVAAEFEGLPAASQFGPEYLTYVLWAVSAEGRPANLGEVMVKNDKGKLTATTRLQNFGLMVTAEPYFAVTYPSDVVVLENVIRADTQGAVAAVDARYELFRRGEYQTEGMTAMALDPKVPLDVYEARNAVRIAKGEGADRYAADTWAKAEAAMARAEDYLNRKQRQAIPTAAREAVQMAEDARLITLRRQQEERLAGERRAAAEREAKAKAEASAAEAERKLAEERKQAEERRRMEAEVAAAREAQKRAEAEAAEQAALRREQESAQQAKQAQEAAERAEREKHALRAKLLEQFNRVLPTRDTPRGLVVNMGDVLFDTGKAELRSPAREALARLSGIVLNYPQLRLDIEGHTDNTGGEQLNQKLSEQRAESVRQYLGSQGLDASHLSARGLGESMPVADNATAAGRKKNRRVEITVSGEVIGTQIGAGKP